VRKGHISNVVERAIVQFRLNQTLELAESFTVDSADLQTASPFQIVGAAWLKARLVNFSNFGIPQTLFRTYQLITGTPRHEH